MIIIIIISIMVLGLCLWFFKKKSKHKSSDLDKGFHPEILYLINKDYAEYVDYDEI